MRKLYHACPLCDDCWPWFAWRFVGPRRWTPVRVPDTRPEVCLRCGAPTESGIYVRAKPEELKDAPEEAVR